MEAFVHFSPWTKMSGPRSCAFFFTKICSNRWPLLAMPSRLSVCRALPRLVIFSFSWDHMLPIILIWVRACFGFGWGKMLFFYFYLAKISILFGSFRKQPFCGAFKVSSILPTRLWRQDGMDEALVQCHPPRSDYTLSYRNAWGADTQGNIDPKADVLDGMHFPGHVIERTRLGVTWMPLRAG